jgi:hypothetical protein
MDIEDLYTIIEAEYTIQNNPSILEDDSCPNIKKVYRNHYGNSDIHKRDRFDEEAERYETELQHRFERDSDPLCGWKPDIEED